MGVYTNQKATFVGDTGACEVSVKGAIETEMARLISRVGNERSNKEIVGKVSDMLNFCYPVATSDVLKNAMIQTADRMGLDREKIVNPGKANH